jgi:integrase
MAWIEQRCQRFRLAFRFNDEKHTVNLKSANRKDAEACKARLEDNLRLVERGRLVVPPGADLGLFLMTDGKLERPVAIVRVPTLAALFANYQTNFTAGAKEAITRRMEDVHIKHLTRIIGGKTPVSDVTAGTIQTFIDARSRETYNGHLIKPKSVKKVVATLRFVWNWSFRQGYVPMKCPAGETVYAKEKQPEPFRTYAQIKAIISRGNGFTQRRLRELWDGLFLDPAEVAEVLEIVRRKTRAKWFYPFLVAAAHTGARRSELFRARVQDFDFEANLVLLREKKRNKDRETLRTVDMTPFLAMTVKDYLARTHPGGEVAFCSAADTELTDRQAWRAFRTAVSGSKWEVLRGYHALRHSFASNLAAAGVDSRVISELMGHQTAEMEARYRHLFPAQRRAAVMAVFGPSVAVGKTMKSSIPT